jgi:ubiquinone/menaquinone biosynthesis C-methylase UbiE
MPDSLDQQDRVLTHNGARRMVGSKARVRHYWDETPCGSTTSSSAPLSRRYFDEIEAYRYQVEPEIFSFAQFTRYHGKRVLEVGVGTGTDFLQWARAGAQAYGLDLTAAGTRHVRRRLELYELPGQLCVGDAEILPFPNDSFDLVYSFGVIHHTPDTAAALREMMRVVRPGGRVKVMVYNRHSLTAFWLWVRKALLRGKLWKSLTWCLANFMESPGTKAYTARELREMVSRYPAASTITAVLTVYDRLGLSRGLVRRVGMVAAWLAPTRFGWWLTVDLVKAEVHS